MYTVVTVSLCSLWQPETGAAGAMAGAMIAIRE